MRQVGPGYCTHFMGRLRKWYIAPKKKHVDREDDAKPVELLYTS